MKDIYERIAWTLFSIIAYSAAWYFLVSAIQKGFF